MYFKRSKMEWRTWCFGSLDFSMLLVKHYTAFAVTANDYLNASLKISCIVKLLWLRWEDELIAPFWGRNESLHPKIGRRTICVITAWNWCGWAEVSDEWGVFVNTRNLAWGNKHVKIFYWRLRVGGCALLFPVVLVGYAQTDSLRQNEVTARWWGGCGMSGERRADATEDGRIDCTMRKFKFVPVPWNCACFVGALDLTARPTATGKIERGIYRLWKFTACCQTRYALSLPACFE